jgi:hypothetical protein
MCNYVHLVTGRQGGHWTVALGGFGIGGKSGCTRQATTTLLKGTVSLDGYFFEDPNVLISTFCICADGF